MLERLQQGLRLRAAQFPGFHRRLDLALQSHHVASFPASKEAQPIPSPFVL